MKYQALWVIGLLCVSCSPTRLSVTEDASVALSPSPAPTILQSPSPIASPPIEASPTPSPDQSTETPATSPTAVSEPQQDYAATSPIPATGQVTIRNDIRNLDVSQLIANCPADSAPYAFAESTHYRVQICSQEYDPWQPKYYVGQAKDGSGELRITSDRPDEARQLIFQSGGYTYILYRDGARPEQINAYLEVYTPSGKNYAEALWYLYEATRP